MPTTSRARKRTRGEVETPPSGGLRVRVYAGQDPVSGKRHYLTEIVPPGPRAAREAEKVRTKFLSQVDERRSPRTRATVGQLMDRFLELATVDEGTLPGYESIVRVHVKPLLGDVAVDRLDAKILDSFYRQLRTCRTHCRGARGLVDHRTARPHECDERCGPHCCRPLAPASVRKVRAVLCVAGKRAVRWGWLGTNVFATSEPLPMPRPDPSPPSALQAARIVDEAWSDPDWGMLVWLAMMTGARRGELCALRWRDVDLERSVLTVRASIAQKGARSWEKDTKTHQQRRITLDDQTVELLRSYNALCASRAGFVTELPLTSRLFSPVPGGTEYLRPDTVTQHFSRMCARLGWDIHLHQLRHYSATELIAAGVDVRTVAGRLGHSGGGVTTLRVYSAWVSEADQRAAGALARRSGFTAPVLGPDAPVPAPREADEETKPYRKIAAHLRGAITSGILVSGATLPTVTDLAERYGVAPSTAHRGIAELASENLVTVSRGRRAVVC